MIFGHLHGQSELMFETSQKLPTTQCARFKGNLGVNPDKDVHAH